MPDDPDEIVWDYEQGTELRDPTYAEVADYFYRIASWYIAGGFTDEHGCRHESGHQYRFDYWEVLCEPNFRSMPPDVYTGLYDAVVERLRPLDPQMKFIGLSVTTMCRQPEYFWSFLDPANHADGIPLDAFSYHFYAMPDVVNPYSAHDNPPFAHWRDTFFAQAEGFLDQVRFIDSIRRRLAPDIKTFVNELGSFTPDLMNPKPDIPDEYWALSAAVQSYLWAQLVALGIDLVGIAEFMDYPGMIPGATLIDWNTGEPNQRYRALALLLNHFGPGDRLATTTAGEPATPDHRVHAQGFIKDNGMRKLLLINKTDQRIDIVLPGEDQITLEAYATVVMAA